LNDLEAFAERFLTSPILARVPYDAPIRFIDGVVALTLFREPPFQVQMFIGPPNHIVPAHTHPNVDSIEVYVGGDVWFTRRGRYVLTPRHTKRLRDGTSRRTGASFRVLPTDVHGGHVGPRGGVFLSIQQWLNGVPPTCVSSDYVGVVMGPQHLAGVTTGAPVLKSTLTVSDEM
jgi:hypothetical protein